MMSPPPTEQKGGGGGADCPICGKPKKDHSFTQLKECWHKAKGYEPDQYKPDPKYQKGQDRT